VLNELRGIPIPITTMIVSAYKAGKWINTLAHSWLNHELARKIVMSLRFK